MINGQLSRVNESWDKDVLPSSMIRFKLINNDSGVKINGIPIKTIPSAKELVEGF